MASPRTWCLNLSPCSLTHFYFVSAFHFQIQAWIFVPLVLNVNIPFTGTDELSSSSGSHHSSSSTSERSHPLTYPPQCAYLSAEAWPVFFPPSPDITLLLNCSISKLIIFLAHSFFCFACPAKCSSEIKTRIYFLLLWCQSCWRKRTITNLNSPHLAWH